MASSQCSQRCIPCRQPFPATRPSCPHAIPRSQCASCGSWQWHHASVSHRAGSTRDRLRESTRPAPPIAESSRPVRCSNRERTGCRSTSGDCRSTRLHATQQSGVERTRAATDRAGAATSSLPLAFTHDCAASAPSGAARGTPARPDTPRRARGRDGGSARSAPLAARARARSRRSPRAVLPSTPDRAAP